MLQKCSLLKFEVNPLVLKTFKIYQNLELNDVKFKIRGGLLGILLKLDSAEVRVADSAEDMDSTEGLFIC